MWTRTQHFWNYRCTCNFKRNDRFVTHIEDEDYIFLRPQFIAEIFASHIQSILFILFLLILPVILVLLFLVLRSKKCVGYISNLNSLTVSYPLLWKKVGVMPVFEQGVVLLFIVHRLFKSVLLKSRDLTSARNQGNNER